MALEALLYYVMLSLPKHLRPFGYAQIGRIGQSKDPPDRTRNLDPRNPGSYNGGTHIDESAPPRLRAVEQRRAPWQVSIAASAQDGRSEGNRPRL